MKITISGIPIIDQVWGQDGWILAKFFFFCIFIDWDKVQVYKSHKKHEAYIQQSWLNKLSK